MVYIYYYHELTFYIADDYEDSKRFEIFRRYSKLKGIIKRTVMYTKLEVLPDISHALGIASMAVMTAPGIRKPLGQSDSAISSCYLNNIQAYL